MITTTNYTIESIRTATVVEGLTVTGDRIIWRDRVSSKVVLDHFIADVPAEKQLKLFEV